MNKKNLAMAMAAVTVVGSAAPVFAQVSLKTEGYTVVQDKYEKLLKDLKAGLKDDKITQISIYFDGEYITTVTAGEGAGDKLETLTKNQLKGLGDGKYVEFAVEYKTGESTAPAAKLTAQDLTNIEKDLNDNKTTEIIGAGNSNGTDKGMVSFDGTDSTASTALTLNDIASWEIVGDTLTIKPKNLDAKLRYGIVKSSAVDGTDVKNITLFTQETFKVGEEKTAKKVADADTFKFDENNTTVSGLGYTPTTPGSPSVGKDDTTIKVIKAVEKTIDVKSNSSTKAQDLAKQYVFQDGKLEDDGTESKNNISYIAKHVSEVAVEDTDGDLTITLYPDGKRLSTLSATTKTPTNLGDEDAPAKIVLKASKLKDLEDYLDDLVTYNNSYSNVQAVAGSDRIETAIELSRKFYNSTDSKALYENPVNSIVLVGSQAIVDGLVASPLAAEKDAPLLLSSKDKLDSSVRAEIKRVMKLDSSTGISNKKEVFIAGGVNSVSKAVENELKDMGLKVTRLSGDDRYETSLAIADEIDIDDKAYVVGGTGLADAMSIAPVASQLKNGEATPIVVVDGKADKLSKEAEDFLDDAQVDIIGGENSVSAKMEDYIDDATGKSPERISGADRQATNAEVIKEYFKKDSVTNYFLAKDGSTKEDQLVDALAAAAVAGNFGAKYDNDTVTGTPSPAPIVLATDNLSAEQHVAVSKTVNGDGGKNLVQVGQGIADSVVKKLKELLDM
ncbi:MULTISPECIES: S-layer protein SlpA [unclassified Clostridioides]|uniref:S-layer protein SlpA n=1 Tax=unclassified Clostridioides TaxID=2635829 RepID=UPI001D12E1B5|nr:S-layer protein SlpA [Clostridioides sp. ES-S-0049-03]MCC0676593.1 S-layer protein SlpA [Clostridioides sp. ES-W-0018-02]MCC0711206.1 S-layer protein SlpA [Clostridioides sp. ES-W-0017-02]